MRSKAAPAPNLDARRLEIRPICADDKAALIEAFERFGPESRYRRFLSPHDRLSASELRYFTEVDHHDHEAVVAVESDSGQGVGVARYVRSTENPKVAEVAVAVVDDWQRHGVGTRLVAALAERARAEGIEQFSALVLADNALMLNLLNDLGQTRVLQSKYGTLELTVDLLHPGLERLRRFLRAVGRGEVTALPMRDVQRSEQAVPPTVS